MANGVKTSFAPWPIFWLSGGNMPRKNYADDYYPRINQPYFPKPTNTFIEKGAEAIYVGKNWVSRKNKSCKLVEDTPTAAPRYRVLFDGETKPVLVLFSSLNFKNKSIRPAD